MATNKGHTPTPLQEAVGITLESSTLVDDVLNCRFRRAIQTIVEEITYDLESTEYYILLAKGPLSKYITLPTYLIEMFS